MRGDELDARRRGVGRKWMHMLGVEHSCCSWVYDVAKGTSKEYINCGYAPRRL